MLLHNAALKTDFHDYYMNEDNNYFDCQPGVEYSAVSSAYLLQNYGNDYKVIQF